jgi:hypothetical protein
MEKLRRQHQLGDAAFGAESRWYKLHDFNFFFQIASYLPSLHTELQKFAVAMETVIQTDPERIILNDTNEYLIQVGIMPFMQDYKRLRQFPELGHCIYTTYGCLLSVHNHSIAWAGLRPISRVTTGRVQDEGGLRVITCRWRGVVNAFPWWSGNTRGEERG